MNSSSTKSRPLFIFYLLVAYVVLQFAWWTYSMFQLNSENTHLKTELNLLKGESPEQIVKSGNEMNISLHKRWLMISGEGSVFIGLLLFGVYQIRKTLKKENELANRQKNFMLSVTHELKSPIASAKLQLQTLQKRELPRDKQQELLSNAVNDTERLNNLVENILLAAKIDDSNFTFHKERTDLSAYVSENMSQLVQLFDYKHRVILDIDDGIFMSIDRTTFPSIILNLFENAVKYSPPDSTITLSLKKRGGHIILAVKDEGTGIPEEHKKKIFEKFYRVGSEETRKTKGTGLGLYIIRHLSEQHGGAITVRSNNGKGSVFEVTFG